MIVVGITGGIGSGKSTVCKVFEVFQIPVFYSDLEAKRILFQPQIKQEIVELLGEDVLTVQMDLDTKKMAQKVFGNELLLNALNQIIHPAVAQAFENWLNKQTSKIVLKEVAILFETKGDQKCDYVITVVADETTRIQRVLKRDQRSESQIRNIISQQMSDEEKIKRSDFVINNNYGQKVLPQVMAILKSLEDKVK